LTCDQDKFLKTATSILKIYFEESYLPGSAEDFEDAISFAAWRALTKCGEFHSNQHLINYLALAARHYLLRLHDRWIRRTKAELKYVRSRETPVEPSGLGNRPSFEDLLTIFKREHNRLKRIPGYQVPNASRTIKILRMRIAGLTLDEISPIIGVSRERVRQIEERAISMIRISLGLDAPTPVPKQLEYQGELLTIKQLSQKFDRLPKAIRRWVKSGRDFEECANKYRKHRKTKTREKKKQPKARARRIKKPSNLVRKKYEYNGRALSCTEWASELRCTEKTLRSFLRKHSIAEAVKWYQNKWKWRKFKHH
jgi:RNA polymerase sigma factor (sigma-70 family)